LPTSGTHNGISRIAFSVLRYLPKRLKGDRGSKGKSHKFTGQGKESHLLQKKKIVLCKQSETFKPRVPS